MSNKLFSFFETFGSTKNGVNNDGYSNISPKDAKVRIDSGEKITILDVRTQQEYMEGHIPNSILIPYDEILKRAQNELREKDSPIFVYCRSGRRSESAIRDLIRLGYTDIYNLGGITNWPYEIK